MSSDFYGFEIVYSERKNLLLEAEGSPTFIDVVTAIKGKKIISVSKSKTYENQYLLYVNAEGRKHICVVPCKILNGKHLILITVYESRTASKKFMKELK